MPPKFSNLPAHAAEDPRVPPTALRILAAICTFTDQHGVCWPSQSTIAYRLGVSRTTVNRQIKTLVELGYLEVTRRETQNGGETSCMYQVVLNATVEQQDAIANNQQRHSNKEQNASPTPVHIERTPLCAQDAHPPVQPECPPLCEQNAHPPVHIERTPLCSQDAHPLCAQDATLTYQLTTQLTTQLTSPQNNKEEEAILTPAQENFETSSSPFSPEADFQIWFDDEEPSVQMPEYPTEIPDDPAPTREGAWQVSFQPVHYPETVAQAQKHPDLRIYIQLTNIFPGDANYITIIDTIQFLRQKHKTDQALLEYLRPFWLRWKTSKRKDGLPYSPMNLAWLTNWAMNNLMPERPDDNGDWVVSTSPQAFANARIPMPAVAQ